jgi:drug/metabolite transporter (DMT)-like permease
VGLRNAVELLILAAIWGGSFLFMRVAAPELGPLALVGLRLGLAALVVVPLLAATSGFGDLRGRAWPVLVVGALNSALPFCLLTYATLSVTAGFASILNATTPLWGGLVAHFWLRERLDRSRAVGLATGFAGVAFLVWGRVSFKAGGSGLAVIAALLATLSYGVAASYTKRRLTGVNPLAVSAGSQLAAALLVLPAAAASWPAHPVSTRAWVSAALLAVVCTAFAYGLFFRLIARVGPARTIAVTFLIPPFAVLWGALFLGEAITGRMVLGSAVIFAGTALATGLARLPDRVAATGTRRDTPPARAP